MIKTFKPSLVFAVALIAALIPASAQTRLVPTTLSAAVTSGSTRTIVVASASGFAANTTVAVVDRELMAVTAVSSTTITLQRGASGTVATPHASGAYVFVGPPGAFSPTSWQARVDTFGNPAGSCTASQQLYLPVVNVRTGTISDCQGGVWKTGTPFNSGAATSQRYRIVSPDSGGTAYTSLNTNGTAVGATTLYCTEVWLPSNKLLTGIGVLNGTTVTGNARYVVLYDSGGTALANSALAGQASVTASVYETYAFTSTFFAIGPAQYFGCIQDNAVGSTTVRMVVTGTQDNILTKGQTSAVFGTVPALTVPTSFTTAVGPYIYLY